MMQKQEENLNAFLASKPAEEKQEDNEETTSNPEEEIQGNWKPLVELPEVEVKTGEEELDLLYKQRSKLFRWRDNQWKERGLGDIRIMRNRAEPMKTRVIMRQEQTKKVCANFIIEDDPLCNLQPHMGSDRAYTWMAYDFSDEKAQVEKLAIKFGQPENAQAFKEAFNAGKEFNKAKKEGREAVLAPVIQQS